MPSDARHPMPAAPPASRCCTPHPGPLPGSPRAALRCLLTSSPPEPARPPPPPPASPLFVFYSFVSIIFFEYLINLLLSRYHLSVAPFGGGGGGTHRTFCWGQLGGLSLLMRGLGDPTCPGWLCPSPGPLPDSSCPFAPLPRAPCLLPHSSSPPGLAGGAVPRRVAVPLSPLSPFSMLGWWLPHPCARTALALCPPKPRWVHRPRVLPPALWPQG